MPAEIKSIRIARCNEDGTVVATPVVVDLCIENSDVKSTRNYSEINCLLSSVPDRKKGSSSVSGSITFNITKQSAYLIGLLFSGEYVTNTVLTADDWAADTVTEIGDIVHHSDDKHSLTCVRIKGDGKTGTDEPTLTKLNNTEIIYDNNVVWEATPLLNVATFEYKNVAPKIIIEFGVDDGTGADIFYKQYKNAEFGTIPISASVDDKVPQFQVNIVAGSVIDSEDVYFTTPLADVEGAKLVTLGKDYYSSDPDDTTVLFDGNSRRAISTTLTVEKGLEIVKELNDFQTNKRTLKADGSISLNFTTEEYNTYKYDTPFTLEVKHSTPGCYFDMQFNTVKSEETDITFQSKDDIMLDPNIWATDTNGLYNLEIQYPSFIDTDGNIVNF